MNAVASTPESVLKVLQTTIRGYYILLIDSDFNPKITFV